MEQGGNKFTRTYTLPVTQFSDSNAHPNASLPYAPIRSETMASSVPRSASSTSSISHNTATDQSFRMRMPDPADFLPGNHRGRTPSGSGEGNSAGGTSQIVHSEDYRMATAPAESMAPQLPTQNEPESFSPTAQTRRPSDNVCDRPTMLTPTPHHTRAHDYRPAFNTLSPSTIVTTSHVRPAKDYEYGETSLRNNEAPLPILTGTNSSNEAEFTHPTTQLGANLSHTLTNSTMQPNLVGVEPDIDNSIKKVPENYAAPSALSPHFMNNGNSTALISRRICNVRSEVIWIILRLACAITGAGALGLLLGPMLTLSNPIPLERSVIIYAACGVAGISILSNLAFMLSACVHAARYKHGPSRIPTFLVDFVLLCLWFTIVCISFFKLSCPANTNEQWCKFYHVSLFFSCLSAVLYIFVVIGDLIEAI
ncbi:uncharacterized protein VTP21DRAFT_9875 [Calcarisporiella thermophila]|uniref:uncharacterized protein n=1 Tax=Calcarisporiella thermophila TaxID=911321 RepID=UPI0037442D77